MSNTGKKLCIQEQDLADNPTARLPICILLDTSHSMNDSNYHERAYNTDLLDGKPIKELNEGVKVLIDELKADELTRYTADVSILTFGGHVKTVKDFGPLEGFDIDELDADHDTPMGQAVSTALELLSRRKEQYKNQMIEYHQPWLVLMTDGAPTDEYGYAAEEVCQLIRNRKLVIFPVGVGDKADMEVLKEFSPNKDPLKLKGLQFTPFFEWFSASVSVVSHSMPGDNVKPNVKGIATWAEDGLDGLF